ncbi:citryl-CoA lyase [Chitinimonas viridis]|uniref:Citryl-CoA lyase n=1 Tax=Chitinimonas viridis TaxID=664880 RepID=A0ABT8B1H2_9NEIS|nr:citryl-CoA lyase [Chitinimonas viridis]MDN3575383.1 citryl-CoA lyase [Chitinimonas viridis]
MSAAPRKEVVHTRIWQEEAEPDNPFATRVARCHGYDVYGDMLGKAGWIEMLYLLFRGERPSAQQAALLEALAVALANPGPRDPMVHAAMCGGVAGSTAAASLMAALAVGAGQNGGAREVWLAMQAWESCGTDLALWHGYLSRPPQPGVDIWPEMAHPAGFAPHGVQATLPVRQLLAHLARHAPELAWLQQQRIALEADAGLPMGMLLPVAATLHVLGFTAEQGEMLVLLLRLPGAAVHALEQWRYGFKRFPFFPVELTDDPAGKVSA